VTQPPGDDPGPATPHHDGLVTESVDLITKALFTARGFLHEMRQWSSQAGGATSLTSRGSLLAPITLDEYPDPATAWVTGIYALVLKRRADPAGLRGQADALRNGASPAAVLEAVIASPEAQSAGTWTRPDLAKTYVTGAHLAALGRLPHGADLAAHVAELADGLSEAQLLRRLLESEEPQTQFRYPPPPVDSADILARTLQTVALRAGATSETTVWAREALDRGVAPRLIVRSLARRLHGRSAKAVYVALTARPRAAAARMAAERSVLREELARERAWHWQLQRATWQRMERLEALVAAGRPSAPEEIDVRTASA
jgi:hypothetical protein